MSRQILPYRYAVTLLITLSVFLTGLVQPIALAQNDGRKPVVISFGQPNIWSLEQAHYLLARMHMTNLELQAKALEEEDLNPNATHATRIEIIKQILEIGAEYDQGIGFQNQRLVENSRFNDTRRRNLITNRDRLRNDSLQLSLDIEKLKRERATISDSESDRAKELNAEIEQKEKSKTAIDTEVGFHETEIGNLTEPQGTITAPTPSTSPANRLPASVLDQLKAEDLNKLMGEGRDPKLNATTKLDNTVQFQYEIIAKQLTLLRDEVGPGERLVFIELPQSLYTTPGSGDEKMAQTWWHVNGYTRTETLVRLLLELYEVEWKWKRIQLVPAFSQISRRLTGMPCGGDYKNQIRATLESNVRRFGEMYHEFRCERESARERVLRNLFREASSDFDRIEQGGARDTSKLIAAIAKVIGTKATSQGLPEGKISPSAVEARNKTRTHEDILNMQDELLNLLSSEDPPIDATLPRQYTFESGIEFIPIGPVPDSSPSPDSLSDIDRRTVRTVDIIPRQSSLNVNDIQTTVKATGILAAFKFLFGFAGQVNFQRQREQYEQFIHQELYASGFGKGNSDFGWTFGALPGTKRVAPGVRTTYAAIVVPDDAESLVLSARGCYFPRKDYQPLGFEDTGHAAWSRPSRFGRSNCGDQQTYILPIPGGGNTSSFWVTAVNYEPVSQGDFVTVSVRGNNFSSQMGVLVNGVPLHPTVGLAQPNLLPKKVVSEGGTAAAHPSECTGKTDICGRYERVDQGQMVFSFRLPTNSNIGIPTITLVAPGKSVDLNALINLTVNGSQLGKTPDDRYEVLSERNENIPFMFGARPPSTLAIGDLVIVNYNAATRRVHALLRGAGFNSLRGDVYLNELQLGVSPNTRKVFKSSNLYELHFDLPPNETLNVAVVQDKQVVTKPFPRPGALNITNITVLVNEVTAGNNPSLTVVKLEGSGFSQPPQLEVIAEGAVIERLVLVSSSEVILRLRGAQVPVVIRVTDTVNNSTVSRFIESIRSP